MNVERIDARMKPLYKERRAILTELAALKGDGHGA